MDLKTITNETDLKNHLASSEYKRVKPVNMTQQEFFDQLDELIKQHQENKIFCVKEKEATLRIGSCCRIWLLSHFQFIFTIWWQYPHHFRMYKGVLSELDKEQKDFIESIDSLAVQGLKTPRTKKERKEAEVQSKIDHAIDSAKAKEPKPLLPTREKKDITKDPPPWLREPSNPEPEKPSFF